MAVTVQAGSYAQWAGTLDSASPFGHNLPVTVAAGTDSVLIAVITSSLGNLTDYTVTYGGVAMTGLYAQSAGPNVRHMIFYMKAPPVGTANLFVGVSGWWGQNATVRGVVLDGVNQTTPFGTPVSNANAYGTSPWSTSISVAASELLLSVFGTYVSSTITPDGGETAFASTLTEGNSTTSSMLAYKTGGATSTSMTFTNSAQPSTLAVAVKPTVASVNGSGSGTPSSFSLAAPAASAVGTGGSGGGTTNGSGTGTPSSFSMTATAATAVGTTAGVGTIVTPPLKNNAGTLYASVSGWTVNVFNASTGALVVQKTGLSTSSGGILVIADAAIAPGTTYTYEPVHATYGRRLPTGTAV